MRKLFLFLLPLSFVTTSCNDGDVITIDLTFDKELELCGDINSANYVVYDIKDESPFESLTLLLSGDAVNDLIFFPTESPYTGSLNINSATQFNYRTYDGDPLMLICQEIPSSTVNITNDYQASSGTVNFTSTYDDVDGMRTVTVVFTITDTNLEILNTDLIELGTYTSDPFEL